MNATDPETALRIQSLLKSTTDVVDRVPIAEVPLDNIRAELRALCLRVASDIVEAEAAENGPAGVRTPPATGSPATAATASGMRWPTASGSSPRYVRTCPPPGNWICGSSSRSPSGCPPPGLPVDTPTS